MTNPNLPGTCLLAREMHVRIVSAEIAVQAAGGATEDAATRAVTDDLLHLLSDAGNAVAAERPALLDEVLTSLVCRAWPTEAAPFIADALAATATALVCAEILSR